MAKETMEAAAESGPFAFVIPSDQVDFLTATDMVRQGQTGWSASNHAAPPSVHVVSGMFRDNQNITKLED